MQKINRRTAIMSSCGIIPAMAAPAIASGVRRMTMVTAWPRDMKPMHNTAERLASRIAAMSDGQIIVDVLGAGEKMGAFETLDALAAGAADLSHGTSYYWTKKSPAFAFFATIPFGMMANEHNAWLEHGGGQQLWDELGERFGVKPLAGGNTGVQSAGWFRAPLRTRRDLEGLVIRFPSLGGELFRSMGAVPKLTAASEIKALLDSGDLDAAEWICPWVDLEFGMHLHAKNCYYPGVHEPGHTLEVNVSLQKWNNYDDATRAIIMNACQAESAAMPNEFAAQNAAAVGKLSRDFGVKFLPLPNDIVRAMRHAAPGLIEEFVAEDAFSKRVHASYNDFARSLGRWSEFSERAYWRARFT
ncbi:MAG: TRAP transporter substrate-binding protein [Pseudomonadota bacterium]|nr:TRAP transporter substrate-binding protein [Pseudomonadota bacterium]